MIRARIDKTVSQLMTQTVLSQFEQKYYIIINKNKNKIIKFISDNFHSFSNFFPFISF